MSQSPTSAGSAISARDYTPIAYCNTPYINHATSPQFLRVMREILLPRHHRKNTISHSFKKALFRMKDAPDFLRFQWEISLSVRKCWLSLRRARLRIFFKTSYIFNKTAAKPIFSFVKSTNYLSNQQKYKKQQKIQRKITRFFKINFIFTAKSCN